MDTIRAIARMASEHADRLDPVRAEQTARLPQALRRELAARSSAIPDPTLREHVSRAIAVLHDLHMRPADDRATQIRLASAVDRAASCDRPGADVAPSIMRDYLLQEAAAARLAASGGRDPLSSVSDPSSARTALDAASRLRDMAGVQAHAIFDRASPSDMVAIASGRYDAISGGNTAFAVSTQLGMSATTLMDPGSVTERRTTGAKGPADHAPPMPGRTGRER